MPLTRPPFSALFRTSTNTPLFQANALLCVVHATKRHKLIVAQLAINQKSL